MSGLRIPAALLLATMPAGAQSAFALPNGLQVRLAEDHERPYLEARLDLPIPRGEESAGREGALHLLARVLEHAGAGPHNAIELQRVLEERGITLSFQEAAGAWCWTLRCASPHQEEAFALLAHTVLRPDLSGTSLEAQRARLWRERQSLGLAEWAEQRFRWELLEERPEGLATERSLSELGLAQLGALHRRIVRPEWAVLQLRGDLNAAQARQLALLHLGVWGPAPEPALPPAPGANPRSRSNTCLATDQGGPSATLVLQLPEGAKAEPTELLVELLPRWLAAEPGDLTRATGLLQRRGDGRPLLRLRAAADPGANSLELLRGLREWAEKLGSRVLTGADLGVAERLAESRRKILGGPAVAADPKARIAAEDLTRLLRAWCAPDRMRVLLTGALDIPSDHPALRGLGPVEWVRAKE